MSPCWLRAWSPPPPAITMALSGRGHSASACPVCLVPQASLCPHPEAPGRMVSQAPSSLVVVGVVRSHHLAVAMRFRHVRQLIREQSRQHILKTKNLLSRFSRSLGGGGVGGVGRGGEGRWVSRWGWGGGRVWLEAPASPSVTGWREIKLPPLQCGLEGGRPLSGAAWSRRGHCKLSGMIW